MPAIPPYQRIADELDAEIRSGAYDSGKPFPSESALAARFERAPMTVRRALEVLRGRRLIETDWGKGSAVLSPDRRPARGGE